MSEFARIDDLLQAYFTALKEYNHALGAFDMSPEAIRDARHREAYNYAKVRKYKDALLTRAIAV